MESMISQQLERGRVETFEEFDEKTFFPSTHPRGSVQMIV